MRVGVDFRILTVGPDLMRRGMCRYTQQQLRTLLETDHDNEYVLFFHATADASLIDPSIRQAPNVELRRLPLSISIGDAEGKTRLRRGEELQRWLLDQSIDLFHATTPFYPAEPFLATFDACPMVATFYDLIPLFYPPHYLVGADVREVYACALSFVRHASRLLAISAASARDAVSHLGIAADRVDIAYPAVDPCFRVMADEEIREVLASLCPRLRIPERFVFSVSFPHHAKNLETLLMAFARLPPEVRLQLPLVVSATVGEAAAAVWPLAEELGVADDLLFTGPLSDLELTALYNAATFVVHPSRFEGFGLPVVEAMRCGTPVITTTSSSLPEAGGDAAILVDPDDVEALAHTMRELDQDPERREDMARRGLEHSARFDPSQLAEFTLSCYEKAVSPGPSGPSERAGQGPSGPSERAGQGPSGPSERAHHRPRVAMWTALPPRSSVDASTTTDLLGGLSAVCDVEVFVDGGEVPSLGLLGLQPVHHASAFPRRKAQAGFDAVVYQLGGPQPDLFVYAALQDEPGIAVLDDLDLGSSDPMLDRVIQDTLAQVVHDEALGSQISWRYPAARLRTLPLGVADPQDSRPVLDALSARRQLGYGDDPFIVGVLGATGPGQPLDALLEAHAELANGEGGVILVLLEGGIGSEQERCLAQVASRNGLDGSANLTPPRSSNESRTRLAACDAVVILASRYRGNWHAGALRALAARKAVLLSDADRQNLLPSGIVRGFPADGRAAYAIARELRVLRTDAELRSRLSRSGRSYFEEHATVGRSVAGYVDLLREVTGRPVTAEPSRVAATRRRAWEDLVRVLES